MAVYKTGVAGFDTAAIAAERALQAAQPFANQSAATQATTAYLQSIILAGIANGVTTVNETTALNSIVQTGQP